MDAISKRALVLLVLHYVLWGLVFLAPFLPLAHHEKMILGVVFVTLAEITFWVFVWVAGKEVAAKYSQYLSFTFYKNKFFKR